MTYSVTLLSGGMDSATLAYLLHSQGRQQTFVSVHYGQRHSVELEYAERLAAKLGGEHILIDMAPLAKALSGSALTDPSIEVPDGHYAEASMSDTVVPNRNMIMLAAAGGIAVAQNASCVSTAVHAGDHFVYPDCRPEFVKAMNVALRVATEGFSKEGFHVFAPFMDIGKHDIAELGHELGVKYEETWSCYRGGTVHCGRCGTCVERAEAFTLSGVPDPTIYLDPDYARSVLK